MIEFFKYQGAGNDFILIDNRDNVVASDKVAFARKWCNRKFGIGSDGIIFLENSDEADFNMDFYNPDGSQSFCGNGSRCVMQFAKDIGVIDESASFNAVDGKHEAVFTSSGVKVKMGDVEEVLKKGDDYFIDTGSPHYISYRNLQVENDRDKRKIVEFGKQIRYSDEYQKNGTNVNLVEVMTDNRIIVETYERGVEDETFACGTGAVACGLSFGFLQELDHGPVTVEVRGGQLTIYFKREGEKFTDIWLEGPAKFVFKGEING